jgi:exportin-2 (importin alpha re-exporter)
VLKVVIGLFELPEDDTVHPDDHYVQVEDTPGYEVAYNQLAFADRNEHDPLKGEKHPILY